MGRSLARRCIVGTTGVLALAGAAGLLPVVAAGSAEKESIAYFMNFHMVTTGLPVPVGTVFVVHLSCGPPSRPSSVINRDYVFSASESRTPDGLGLAEPMFGSQAAVNVGDRCEITETETGGAQEVASHCWMNSEPNANHCSSSGRVVQFDSKTPVQYGTVVVYTAFTNTSPTPPTFTG